MRAEVTIVTGARSALDYLLEPLMKSFKRGVPGELILGMRGGRARAFQRYYNDAGFDGIAAGVAHPVPWTQVCLMRQV